MTKSNITFGTATYPNSGGIVGITEEADKRRKFVYKQMVHKFCSVSFVVAANFTEVPLSAKEDAKHYLS
jgi:hypothetical protein